MLDEKGRLLEEVEMLQAQKDGLTETLVQSNQELDTSLAHHMTSHEEVIDIAK